MATKHPSQDSDAEIDKLLEKLSSDVVDSTIYTHQTADLEGGQQYLLKGKAEAKQALLALKARWEAEARIDELRILWPRFTDIQVNGTNGPDDNPAARKCIDNRLATLQNQLPTKETK